MGKKMWFGNKEHAQWVPCPAPGLTRRRQRNITEMEFGNGGADVVGTYAGALIYDLDFPTSDASQYEGIDAFSRFASGEWNNSSTANQLWDNIRFIDPMWADVNLAPAEVSAPYLLRHGWKNWIGTTTLAQIPAIATTNAATYHRPGQQITWSITAAANTTQGKVFTMLVPPGYTLHVAWCGAVTGTARLNLYSSISGLDAAVTPTTGAQAIFNTYGSVAGGANGGYANISFLRTTSATSTITMNSMVIQCLPTGITPSLANFVQGKGHWGLKFAGQEPLVENYRVGDKGRHLIGMAGTKLIETEPWL